MTYAWRIAIDGRDTGIVETNLGWASDYWLNRQTELTLRAGRPVRCSMIQVGTPEAEKLEKTGRL